ncbi:MAG: 23S rRNA (adenine(2503)-C(2))-methyltransferase RlmN [Candidatus Coatesbacteria bacterium]|nr:23S rRNA (adenine(2503)-C(2))-methyltransferase RlmN [Candidatus Coatesbacteria bacterium]
MKNNIYKGAIDYIEKKLEDYNEKPFRKDQIWLWLFKKDATSFDEMTDLPKKLKEKLESDFYIKLPKLIKTIKSEDDKTIKLALRMEDRAIIETVWMKEQNRHTVCISCQAGCKLGCRFCATARIKFKRNLEAYEMISQLLYFKRSNLIDRVVFMGMGEPMFNLTEIEKAIEVITSDYGLTISPKRITISTSGIPHGIVYIADKMPKIGVAISLNSVSEKTRTELMPIARKYPIRELLNAAKYYTDKTGRKITFEYVLISGVNDSRDDARHLLELTREIPCKINIIPYNPIPSARYKKPDSFEIDKFRTYLMSGKATITVRFSKGSEILAGCGQLGAEL